MCVIVAMSINIQLSGHVTCLNSRVLCLYYDVFQGDGIMWSWKDSGDELHNIVRIDPENNNVSIYIYFKYSTDHVVDSPPSQNILIQLTVRLLPLK